MNENYSMLPILRMPFVWLNSLIPGEYPDLLIRINKIIAFLCEKKKF